MLLLVKNVFKVFILRTTECNTDMGCSSYCKFMDCLCTKWCKHCTY